MHNTAIVQVSGLYCMMKYTLSVQGLAACHYCGVRCDSMSCVWVWWESFFALFIRFVRVWLLIFQVHQCLDGPLLQFYALNELYSMFWNTMKIPLFWAGVAAVTRPGTRDKGRIKSNKIFIFFTVAALLFISEFRVLVVVFAQPLISFC